MLRPVSKRRIAEIVARELIENREEKWWVVHPCVMTCEDPAKFALIRNGIAGKFFAYYYLPHEERSLSRTVDSEEHLLEQYMSDTPYGAISIRQKQYDGIILYSEEDIRNLCKYLPK